MGSIIVLILLFFVIYPIVWGVKGIKRVNSGNKEITPKWLLRLPIILLIFGLISCLFGIMIEPEIPKDDLARYLDNSGIWGGIANEALDYFSPAQIDYINKVNFANKIGWLSLIIVPILFVVQVQGLFKRMFGRVYIQGAAILTTLLTWITFSSFTSAMEAMANNTAAMRALSFLSPSASSFDIQGLFMGLLYFGFMHFAFHKCLDKVYGVITKENYRDYMQLPFNKTVINSSNEPNLKECPHCGGTIQTIAKKCIHCGQWLVEKNETDNIEHDIIEDKRITFKNCVNRKYIIPFVLLLISIIGLCWFIFSQNQRDEDSTTDDNSLSSSNQVERKEYDNLLDTGYEDFIICSQQELYSSHVSKNLTVDLDKDGEDEKIIIGLDQIGIKVIGIKGEQGMSLIRALYQNSGLLEAFDEEGELNKGYYVQASHIDLDNDGKEEVIIALGNKLHEMAISIYKVENDGFDSFKLIEVISGQRKMFVEDDKHIIVPIGSQGLYLEYVYDGGKIVKINNDPNTNQEYDSLAIANSGSENEINGVSGASNQAPNLLPTIEELYKQKTYATEVIKHPLIKDYIISRYSSRFYDLLIESAGVNIPLEYDSKSNKYSSWVRGKYEYTLSYECAINYLEIKLTTVDGIKINKDGKIDCGLWKNGFYKDDFGEDDPNLPYIQVKLDAKKNGYPEPMYLRFCSSEGFKILIDGVKKEADLSIKVKSNGEVIKFAVDEIQDNERCIIYSRDKIDTLVPILENGNFMMSLTYEAPLGDFFRCVVDVTDETKGFLAALKFYLID